MALSFQRVATGKILPIRQFDSTPIRSVRRPADRASVCSWRRYAALPRHPSLSAVLLPALSASGTDTDRSMVLWTSWPPPSAGRRFPFSSSAGQSRQPGRGQGAAPANSRSHWLRLFARKCPSLRDHIILGRDFPVHLVRRPTASSAMMPSGPACGHQPLLQKSRRGGVRSCPDAAVTIPPVPGCRKARSALTTSRAPRCWPSISSTICCTSMVSRVVQQNVGFRVERGPALPGADSPPEVVTLIRPIKTKLQEFPALWTGPGVPPSVRRPMVTASRSVIPHPAVWACGIGDTGAWRNPQAALIHVGAAGHQLHQAGFAGIQPRPTMLPVRPRHAASGRHGAQQPAVTQIDAVIGNGRSEAGDVRPPARRSCAGFSQHEGIALPWVIICRAWRARAIRPHGPACRWQRQRIPRAALRQSAWSTAASPMLPSAAAQIIIATISAATPSTSRAKWPSLP